MTTKTQIKAIDQFMTSLQSKTPGETEFHQAVLEVAESLHDFIEANPIYKEHKILERLVEPDRVVTFKVTWEDDKGEIQVNRGYRIQFNSAIGPYKGGLRFHPTVTLSTFKFLGFEQIFKNSLTTLPMGGAKGGSDFDPKGKSDREVMRFCQAFMLGLFRHIGSNVDIPAGDIGVGSREIGYLFGMYKRIQNNFTGTITGKALHMGGSLVRTEATGYGALYFAEEVLNHINDTVTGKKCVISGSGNVSQYAAEKAIQMGATVLTLSDSSGYVYDPTGINFEKLEFVKELKNVKRGRISEFAEKFGLQFFPGKTPWAVPCDIAFPCATQNEIDENDAKQLVANGCKLVCEGANMPSTPEAIHVFHTNKVLYALGKAANAGGVSVSGLEMTQNRMGYSWTWDELDSKLKMIMKDIHKQCIAYGSTPGSSYVDYVKGANIAGFKKVADAMIAYGIV